MPINGRKLGGGIIKGKISREMVESMMQAPSRVEEFLE